MSSSYAKKMAQMSARIFGEIIVPKNTPNARVIERFALKPLNKLPDFSMDYYPRHLDHDHLFKLLRTYGLFRSVLFVYTHVCMLHSCQCALI